MINILIICDSYIFVAKIINLLNSNNNVRICAVAKNLKEATDIMKKIVILI